MEDAVQDAVVSVATSDMIKTIVEAADFTAIVSGMTQMIGEATPAVIAGLTGWTLLKVVKKAGNKIG